MLAGIDALRHLGPISPQAAARRCLAGLADGVADVRRARVPGRADTSRDALDVLCAAREDGMAVDDTAVAGELFALLLAGHETTATALAWALTLLARDPAAAEAVAAEAGATVRPHLEAMIAEVLRLRPPLVDIAREVREPVRLGDRLLSPGELVVIAPPLVHRHGHAAPDTFDAERFLAERPDPLTWLPFGGGGRRCLGASLALLELREILAFIVDRFELEPGGRRPPKARLHGTALVGDRRESIILRPR
jgi:cytochrome P450